jgi:hypothetical protein
MGNRLTNGAVRHAPQCTTGRRQDSGIVPVVAHHCDEPRTPGALPLLLLALLATAGSIRMIARYI